MLVWNFSAFLNNKMICQFLSLFSSYPYLSFMDTQCKNENMDRKKSRKIPRPKKKSHKRNTTLFKSDFEI